MPNLPATQRGVSKLGVLILFICLAGMLTVSLKLLPLYINHNLIVNLATAMVDSNEADNLSQAEFRQRMGSGLRINNILNFDLNKIKLTKSSGKAVINIAYENRVSLIANIDVVVIFDSQIPQ
ncbi:MAG: hypothetical protein COC19_07180 [SAR86 cluster bacterium]|uniref:DUF4845 domain-containing protein n=1 Tax=SAR86 cluster bacterium TaxID=2030880 RepID=A0A2A4MHY2_9GAMM|nr:MAG: hypothetical protein COC19_07180 [SAR86 cluster bacterium]